MIFARTCLISVPILLAVAVSFAPAAHADTYIGLDGSSLTFDNSVEGTVSAKGLRLRMGGRINEAFDLEAHIGGGSSSSTDSFEELGVGYLGGYLKGYIPLGRFSALYALAGFTGVQLTQTLPNGSEFSDDNVSFSFGFGLETRLSKTLDLSADFMRYSLSDDEAFSDVSAISLGLKLYF